MAGASKLRRVVRKIGFPCGGSFSRKQVNDDDLVVSHNISSSRRVIGSARRTMEGESSSPAKNLCAICLEPLSYSTGGSPGQAIFTSQCSHTFHFTCISSNVRHGSVTCPICRAYWTQLPRDLRPTPCAIPSNQEDPVLRILDDSIATFRVHRRSSLRAARYDDDDPIEPDPTPMNNRLQISLALDPLTHSSLGPISYQFTSSSSLSSQNISPNGQKPYPCYNRAYLSVKLAHQQATDLVLVASPNGPHLRLLKQSMALVVFSLRSIDRLAIVTYSSSATRAFPLRRMTSHGKRAALQVIDRLFYMGEADPSSGLKKAMKILEDRAHQNPQSNILHLSDSPTRTYIDLDVEVPVPIHRFHVGFGYGTSNGFVMHEFEEFLARLLGGVIRDTQIRIGRGGEVVKIGELRGGEERSITLELGRSEFVCVTYSYIEGRNEECLRTGEMVLRIEDKGERETEDGEGGGRDSTVGGRTSSAEGWDYHDPYMARRWAKHLHGYRL